MHTLPNGVTFFERGWLSSNNVLLHDDQNAILVDTGYWSHAEQTHALVASALRGTRLNAIFNTHLHSDHCGGNAILQTAYPGLLTYIPPGHASFVDQWDSTALSHTPTGQHCPPFARSHLLNDGDTFVIAGKSWRIHAAPGHDPHSIILFCEEDRLLISADALWENGFGVVFPEIEGVGAFDEVESTLDVIERLNPSVVLPGHGAAFGDIESALLRARSRLKQFRNSPHQHASYAAKVLLKFKLLELQSVDQDQFFEWARSASYLQLLFARYAESKSFEAWVNDLCQSLQKSGACTMNDGQITNSD